MPPLAANDMLVCTVKPKWKAKHQHLIGCQRQHSTTSVLFNHQIASVSGRIPSNSSFFLLLRVTRTTFRSKSYKLVANKIGTYIKNKINAENKKDQWCYYGIMSLLFYGTVIIELCGALVKKVEEESQLG